VRAGAFLVCRPQQRSATAALVVYDGSVARSYAIYSRWGQWFLTSDVKYDRLSDLVADGYRGRYSGWVYCTWPYNIAQQARLMAALP
jgi:hypothetical protein